MVTALAKFASTPSVIESSDDDLRLVTTAHRHQRGISVGSLNSVGSEGVKSPDQHRLTTRQSSITALKSISRGPHDPRSDTDLRSDILNLSGVLKPLSSQL